MDVSQRYRKRRAMTLARRSIFFGAVAFVFVGGAVWSLWLSYFRVQTIIIEGTADNQKAEALIHKYFQETRRWFAPADSIFFVDTDGAREVLQKEHIGIAEITRHYPNTLRIVFRDSAPRFIWCGGSASCFYIAENGLIVAEAPQFSDAPLPLLMFSAAFAVADISLGQLIIDQSAAKFLTEFVASIERWLGVSITAIELLSRADRIAAIPANIIEAKIFTKDDWFVFVRTNDDPKRLVADSALLIKEKIPALERLAYIDLRFKNKAFYKLR